MNKPYNFDNEIVQPKNLNFLANSTDSAIKDIFTTMFGNTPGIVTGLDITGTDGDGTFNVSPGYGYSGDGENITIYSGTPFIIAFTGTKSIFLTYTTVPYNPDPSVNPTRYVNTNVDPITGNPVATESYIYPVITTSSGSDYINLGEVTTKPNQKKFESYSGTGRQALYLGGFLNLNAASLSGQILEVGTVDSTKFTNPLTADIYLNTGVSILNTSTGNFLGSSTNPFSGIYTAELTVHEIHGSSPVIIDGGITMLAGDVINSQSGPVRIDTSGNGVLFGNSVSLQTINGYSNQNITTTAYGSGTIVLQANGGTSKIIIGTNNVISGLTTLMSDLTLGTGISILGSSLNSIGTTSSPISNIRANNTYSTNFSGNAVNANTISGNVITANSLGSVGSPIPSLYVDTIISTSFGSAGLHMQVFTGTSTFTVPSGIGSLKARLWGAGGGGGGGTSPNDDYSTNGANGGSTSVGGSTIIARGGQGGGAGATGATPGASIAPATVNSAGIVGIKMGSAGGSSPSNGLMFSYGGAAAGPGCQLAYDSNDNPYQSCGLSGGDGGMGEYSEFTFPATPGSILSVTVGAGGAGGAGQAGSGQTGGPGLVIIEW